MKDGWDKFKISSDALKANWPIILIALTALSSGITNATQYVTNQDQEAEKNEAIRQVAIGFQSVMTKKEVKPTCDNCRSYLINHVKELH